MRNNNDKLNGLLEVIFQQSIGLLLGLFITGILVPSCSYLAIAYQNEIAGQLLELQMQTEAVRVENDIATSFLNGWFSKTENISKQVLYTVYLETNITDPHLDSELSSDVLQWYENAINELYAEKGKVTGYKLSRDIGIANQQNLIDFYDSKINVMQSIRDLTANWDNQTIEEREQKLKSIETQNKQIESLTYEMINLTNQDASQTQLEWKQVENKFVVLQNRSNQILLKRNAAIGGIALGFVLLIFLVWYGIRFQVRKKTDVVQVKNEPKKAKRNQ